MRKAGTLIAPVVLALGIFAATAPAAGTAIKVVKATSSPIPGPNSQKVACPGHNQILGGGFSAGDNDGLAQKSKPTGLFGWKAEGLIIAGSQSTITTYAICNTAADRKLMRASDSVTLDAGSGPGTPTEGAAEARCPSGWQVISGGYQVKPKFSGGGSGELAVDTNMRKDARTWIVHGGNDGGPTALKAIALCEKKGRTAITQTEDSADADGGSVVKPIAKCAKGEHVVGGGFQVDPDESGGIFPVVSTSAPKDSRHWRISSQPEGSGPTPEPGSATVTAFAECESS
jgi:hypothetical protein